MAFERAPALISSVHEDGAKSGTRAANAIRPRVKDSNGGASNAAVLLFRPPKPAQGLCGVDGAAQAEREFTPRASHASLESEIRAYIREQAKQPDGPANVRAAMLASKDVAAVIFHSPGFLVGINADTHSKLRYEAAERWVPEAYKRMTDSVALRELAPKFDKAAASVRNSFYNPAVAAKASTRVQI